LLAGIFAAQPRGVRANGAGDPVGRPRSGATVSCSPDATIAVIYFWGNDVFESKRTRSGLLVSSRVRKRLFIFSSLGFLFGILPMAVVVFRGIYLDKYDEEPFLRYYLGSLVATVVIMLIVGIRSGHPLSLYVARNSQAANTAKVLNRIALVVPIAGNLYVMGLPKLFTYGLALLPQVSHTAVAVLSNAASCAISGIIGNFAYDLLKRNFKGPKSS
jgi:hypothetical protein